MLGRHRASDDKKSQQGLLDVCGTGTFSLFLPLLRLLCLQYNISSRKHIRTNNRKKHYSCPQCDKAFNESGSQKMHMRTSTGETPYSCTKCTKSFSRSQDLRKHMLIHTGEKPYSCLQCDQAFSQSWDLKIHIKTHIGVSLYSIYKRVILAIF